MTCPLCGTPLTSAPVVGTHARGGRPSRRVCCLGCGLVQVDPQPDPDTLARYYAEEYRADLPMLVSMSDGRTLGEGDPGFGGAARSLWRQRAGMIAGLLELEPGDRVLDVGCGSGGLGRALMDHGCEVFGVELDPDAAALAAERGVHVLGPDLGDVTERFDAVICIHALEHMPDPVHALERMGRLADAVLVQVPNLLQPEKPLERHWLWCHLYDFHLGTLATAFAEAGMGVVRHRVGGDVIAVGSRAMPAGQAPEVPPLEVVSALGALAQEQPAAADPSPQPSLLRRWLEGEDVDQGEVRAAFVDLQRSVQRMDRAIHGARSLLHGAAKAAEEDAQTMMEEHSGDEWLDGLNKGQASGLVRLSQAAMHINRWLDRAMQVDDRGEGVTR